jgi:hypothetical protein
MCGWVVGFEGGGGGSKQPRKGSAGDFATHWLLIFEAWQMVLRDDRCGQVLCKRTPALSVCYDSATDDNPETRTHGCKHVLPSFALLWPVVPSSAVLCCVQGMVTQVTDVKPLASVLTYLDQDSNTEVYQEVRGVC